MAGWEPSRLFVQKSELHKKSPENSTLCARPSPSPCGLKKSLIWGMRRGLAGGIMLAVEWAKEEELQRIVMTLTRMHATATPLAVAMP
jgi:hypothetical protein